MSITATRAFDELDSARFALSFRVKSIDLRVQLQCSPAGLSISYHFRFSDLKHSADVCKSVDIFVHPFSAAIASW